MKYIQDPNNPRRRIEINDDYQHASSDSSSSNYDSDYSSYSSVGDIVRKVTYYIIFAAVGLFLGLIYAVIWLGNDESILVFVLDVIAIFVLGIAIGVSFGEDVDMDWGEWFVGLLKCIGSLIGFFIALYLASLLVSSIISAIF